MNALFKTVKDNEKGGLEIFS